jgi:hypothetical protein
MHTRRSSTSEDIGIWRCACSDSKAFVLMRFPPPRVLRAPQKGSTMIGSAIAQTPDRLGGWRCGISNVTCDSRERFWPGLSRGGPVLDRTPGPPHRRGRCYCPAGRLAGGNRPSLAPRYTRLPHHPPTRRPVSTTVTTPMTLAAQQPAPLPPSHSVRVRPARRRRGRPPYMWTGRLGQYTDRAAIAIYRPERSWRCRTHSAQLLRRLPGIPAR